jgi:hypothetical protein
MALVKKLLRFWEFRTIFNPSLPQKLTDSGLFR